MSSKFMRRFFYLDHAKGDKECHKMHFSRTNMNNINRKSFPNMVEYSLKDKTLTILLRIKAGFVPEVNSSEISKIMSCYMGY